MTHRISLGFALLLGFAVVGCKDLPVTCGIPESKQDCDCSDGRTGGEQTCRNGEWTECMCPGEPIPQPDGSVDGAVDGSTVDGSAGTSGSGGTGGIDGGSGSGGTGAVDGGSGSGGTGAIDGGAGTGAVDGGSGSGGTGGSFPAAYTGPCAMNVDCGPDAICLKNALATDSHCAPTCDMAADCPAPGSGTAVVECTMAAGTSEKSCRFPCFGAVCPTGLTCEGIVPGASFCY